MFTTRGDAFSRGQKSYQMGWYIYYYQVGTTAVRHLRYDMLHSRYRRLPGTASKQEARVHRASTRVRLWLYIPIRGGTLLRTVGRTPFPLVVAYKRNNEGVSVVNARRLVLTYLCQQVFCILQRPCLAHGSLCLLYTSPSPRDRG